MGSMATFGHTSVRRSSNGCDVPDRVVPNGRHGPFWTAECMINTKRMPTQAMLWQPCGCPAESKAEGVSERLLVQVVSVSQHLDGGEPG